MATSLTYATGYRSAEKQAFIRPRLYRASTNTKPGVIAAPGRGGGAIQPVSPAYFLHVTRTLADAGYPVVSIDAGASLTAWGNDDSVTAVAAARTYLQGTLGAAAGGVYLLGISMGCMALLRYMMANPANVKAAALAIPTVDLAQHYSTNTPSLAQSQISTAYGGVPSSGQNPAQNPASVTKPTRLYVASDDTSAPAAWSTSFASAVGSNCDVVSLGAVGHTPATVSASNVLAFFQAHP